MSKFTGKMQEADTATPVLREPAQSKCTWTISQKPFCVEIYRENAGRYGYHVDQSAGPNTYRKSSVATLFGETCF